MNTTTFEMPRVTTTSRIQKVFQAQKANQFNIGNTSAGERKAKLTALHKSILKYRDDIKKAMYDDFRKHPSEVDLTEVYPVTSEIKHTKSHLSRWMSRKSVSTPLALFGSSSFIKYEPKGVVLIISPWNFPFNLTFGPLVSAIAAGNTVILKPSEHTPHASALMKKIIDETFNENEIAVFEGGIETSKELLELPFNHIFFTGAPSVGKIVMEAAAKHLTSVTLELGGKSPTIVDETANIETAARRISWGKFINNGQICIAPDYLYVHESKAKALTQSMTKHIRQYFSDNPGESDSYSRMVNDRHFRRVKSYLDDSLERGAEVVHGGQTDGNQDFIAPTLVQNVPEDSGLMQNEIFGPVLPIFTYTNIDEVIAKINEGEKPLALYIYSNRKKNIDHILDNTRAGGGCINHNAVHFFNANLPFGGSNNSGIGKAGGRFGFEAFSNARGILKQNMPNALERLLPPYNNFKQKLIDLTIKYF